MYLASPCRSVSQVLDTLASTRAKREPSMNAIFETFSETSFDNIADMLQRLFLRQELSPDMRVTLLKVIRYLQIVPVETLALIYASYSPDDIADSHSQLGHQKEHDSFRKTFFLTQGQFDPSSLLRYCECMVQFADLSPALADSKDCYIRDPEGYINPPEKLQTLSSQIEVLNETDALYLQQATGLQHLLLNKLKDISKIWLAAKPDLQFLILNWVENATGLDLRANTQLNWLQLWGLLTLEGLDLSSNHHIDTLVLPAWLEEEIDKIHFYGTLPKMRIWWQKPIMGGRSDLDPLHIVC